MGSVRQSDHSQLDHCLELFARYQRRLYLYILSMLPSPADADDVLQETNIVVWQKFEQFEPDTDFRAWVFQIAYLQVRKHRERRRREGVCFSNELLDELAGLYQQREDELEQRRQHLPRCVEKLSDDDRRLVDQVYGQGIGVYDLAERIGRKATSIYRSLRRVRRSLFDCIERQVRQEAGQ